jgi:hypothetical protein
MKQYYIYLDRENYKRFLLEYILNIYALNLYSLGPNLKLVLEY